MEEKVNGMDALRERVSTVVTNLSSLSSNVDTRLAAVDSRIAAVDSRFAALESRASRQLSPSPSTASAAAAAVVAASPPRKVGLLLKGLLLQVQVYATVYQISPTVCCPA